MNKTIPILIIMTFFGNCSGGKNKVPFLPIALVGHGPSADTHNAGTGVTQTSPGADGGQPTGTGTLPDNSSLTGETNPAIGTGSFYQMISGYFNTGMTPLSVPPNASLFRIKLFDDPPVYPTENGVIHFVAEYDFIESFFLNAGAVQREIPPLDRLEFKVSSIEAGDSSGNLISRLPAANEERVILVKGKHFAPFVRSLILPPGTYSYLKVNLMSVGSLYYKENKYKINLENTQLQFNAPFTVQAGKVTTLHLQNSREYNDRLSGNSREFIRPDFEENYTADFAYKAQTVQYSIRLELVPVGAEISSPVTRLNLHLAGISALDASNSAYILNDTPTLFEVLSLRNGFVGLAGSNEVSQNVFKLIQVQLGRQHSMESDGVQKPILMEERSQNIFRFNGPFQMENGNVYETYLHLDPNKSVFYIKDKGYVFDPYLEIVSTLNANPDEEQKIAAGLGKFMNLIISESELILKANVTSVTPLIAPNSAGQNIIYSDVTLDIQNFKKGTLPDSQMTLRVPGGFLSGLKLEVTSMPKFQSGETVILFLKKYGNRWGVVRGHLGKVKL